MTVAPSPYVGLLLASAAVLLATAARAARQRTRPGAAPFAAVLCGAAIWAAAKAVGLALPPDHALRLTAAQTAWVGTVAIPPLWVVFALEYTGRPYLVTRARFAALAGVPAVVLVAVWGYPAVDLVWRSFEVVSTGPVSVFGVGTAPLSTTTTVRGPLYFVFLAYAYTLLLAGVVVLFEFVVRYDQLYTEQVVMAVMGVLVPSLGSLLNETGAAPVQGLDVTPFMLSVSAVAFANAVFRHRLFETVPATRRIGRASVIEGMRDAVVVTDTDDRIVDLNPPAVGLFELSLREALGRPVGDCVPVDLDPESESFDATVGDTVHEVTVSPLADEDGRRVGQAFVFRDVTEHRHDRQRVTVLNRVLRHNLRTEINLIGGYARQLEREGTADPELLGRIVDAADELATLGRKAREIERVMDATEEGGRADVEALVADAVRSLDRTRPSLTVDARLAGAWTVTVDPATLKAVLVDLFDALARHEDEENPTVTVRADRRGGTVGLVLENDGDGIPSEEYRVVRGGDETQLDHASGLSLWLVKWGVARTDATVAFDAPHDGAVTLELPVDEDATADDAVERADAAAGGSTPPDLEDGGGPDAAAE